MFTGIVEELGTLLQIAEGPEAKKFTIQTSFPSDSIAVGDSVAVNGCCLTATSFQNGALFFDVVPETIRVSNLGSLKEGDSVNLERSLRYQERVHGHLVQGHVDGVGIVLKEGPSLQISLPSSLARYLVVKGPITIEGVSLTLVSVDKDNISVALVPHTLENTTLGSKREGMPVNIEVDLLAKYVESLERKTI